MLLSIAPTSFHPIKAQRRQVLSRVTADFWLELLHTKRSKEQSDGSIDGGAAAKNASRL